MIWPVKGSLSMIEVHRLPPLIGPSDFQQIAALHVALSSSRKTIGSFSHLPRTPQRAVRGMRLLSCIAVTSLLTPVRALYSEEDHVKILDDEDFRVQVQQDSGVWLVEFYAPWCGHCKELAPEYKKAAKALAGVVNVAAIDCQENEGFVQEFAVTGYPAIMIFGEDKTKPTLFDGDRTAKGIVEAALTASRRVVKARLDDGTEEKKRKSRSEAKKKRKASGKSSVVQLTDATFDGMVLNSGDVWLVEFYAPWCGHCKALAPEWEQAASNLKGSVKLGALEATVNEEKTTEYGIQGFPSIKVFGPNAMGPADAQDYTGERTASAITDFALTALETMGGGYQIKELVSEDAVADICNGRSSCVISVLPHITEGGKRARDGFIKTLEDAVKLVLGKPFKFGWMQGGDQPEFENRFELTFGYPSLVAINLDRKRYVVQRGAFTAEAISEFLQDVMQGRESTVGFDELPAIKTVEPWDGEDVQLDEIEEDDDDDDILSEILANAVKKEEL
uniref:Thioredoxin domain-containing protein n=1 Tax=Peronospora matthiolae TaxID=2874970 RepID=A0AAV1TCQ0_9STRA